MSKIPFKDYCGSSIFVVLAILSIRDDNTALIRMRSGMRSTHAERTWGEEHDQSHDHSGF